MNISRANSGIMELPFKLVIMMLLIGMVVPTVAVGYRDVSRIRYQEKVKNELQDLVFFSRKLMQGGDLSSMTIELDLNGNYFASLDYVELGDTLGEKEWMINHKFSWREHEDHIASVDPLVRLTSADNSTFRLTDGSHRLKLTHIFTENTSFVVVSDLNENIDRSVFT
ncbi:MAG: hypothetical protein ACQEQM_04360 [Thermoplasmatota archaeon]